MWLFLKDYLFTEIKLLYLWWDDERDAMLVTLNYDTIACVCRKMKASQNTSHWSDGLRFLKQQQQLVTHDGSSHTQNSTHDTNFGYWTNPSPLPPRHRVSSDKRHNCSTNFHSHCSMSTLSLTFPVLVVWLEWGNSAWCYCPCLLTATRQLCENLIIAWP